jgi:hypothetical protein
MKFHFLNHVTLSEAKGLPPCGRGFFAPSGLRMTYRIYPELTLNKKGSKKFLIILEPGINP